MHVVSITDFTDFSKEYREDADGSSEHIHDFHITDDSTQWSQELRLHGETDRLQWVAGFYYLHIQHDMFGGMDAEQWFGSYVTNRTDMETDTYAFFGQGEYAINDQWSAIVGLRWSEDKKDIDLTTGCTQFTALYGPVTPANDWCGIVYGGLVQNGQNLSADRSRGEWSGNFELNWRPNDDWLLYAKYSRGNKAGSFNTGFLTFFAVDDWEFDGEVLTDYEGGFKSTWMGGRTRINGAVFYYDYSDFQSFFQQGLSFAVHNVDATVLGGEIEIVTNPWDGWEFMFGGSFLDAEQEDVGSGTVVRDRQMPFSPDVSVNGLGRYEFPAIMGGKMALLIDWSWTDKFTMNAIDHQSLTEDDFWLANARVGWTSSDESVELAVWVKNFTDTDYYVNGFDLGTFSAAAIKVPAAPRWFGGTLRYNWD